MYIYLLNTQFLLKGDYFDRKCVGTSSVSAPPLFNFYLFGVTGREIEMVRKNEMAMKMEMTREMEMGSDMEKGEDGGS
jgi:hypothetical protein